MSALDDLLQLDAQTVHASADMMFEVESVTYKVNGLTSRTLSVQVFRYPTQSMDGVPVPKLEIFVPRSDDDEVGISAVNVGRDLVTVAIEKNGTAVDQPVKQILSEDSGGFMLEII